MNWKTLAGGAAISVMAAAIVQPAEAQVTTSSMRGVVTDTDGAAVSGATVTILHAPSGSVDTATTDASGSFSERGLRVGGPYVVTVTSGSESEQFDNIFLSINETYPLNVRLGEARTLQTVTVIGSATNAGLAMGPASTFGVDTIESLPSVSRDIRDIARLDPLVNVDPSNSGAISIGGTNNRYNSLTIDGIKFNDLFGLNANGFPSQRSPISIDALEQLSVEVAPYDVEFSGFTGGTVNIVTKSGTNDFHGSAYYFYNNDSLSGDQIGNSTISQDFEEKTWGVTLGGPIVKDKLFFFVAYEDFEAEQLLNSFNLPGLGSDYSGVSQSTYDTIRQISQNVYGFDSLSFGSLDPVEDKKLLATIDWDINNDHRAKFTFIQNEGNQISVTNNGADLGSPSTWYDRSEETNSYAVQLFSDWTDAFSTEVKVAYTEQVTGQNSLGGSDFANFEIEVADTDVAAYGASADEVGSTISIGPDYYRHGNELSNELLQIKAVGTYVLGDHVIKGGLEYESQDIYNLFVPGSEGSYTFDSIADFEAATASSLFYNNAVTNDETDGAANWDFSVLSLYVQDEWQVTDKLSLVGGLRYESYSASDTIAENANFVARYGFSNTATLDGTDIILPRIGANYELNDIVTLRAGFGRFSGGSPNVWVSNGYSNDGVGIDSVFLPGPIDDVDGYNIPTAAQAALMAGDGDVNVLDPDFKIPSLWRANLGADFFFEDIYGTGEWEFSVDYIYGQNDDAAYWNDLSCGTESVATAIDGRPIYNCGLDETFVNSVLASGGTQGLVDFYDDGQYAAMGSTLDANGDGMVSISEAEVAPYALYLTNTDEGEQQILTLKFRKPIDDYGLTFGGSYTFQDVTDAHSGTSSTASSNYSDYAAYDRQNPVNAVSNYQREHEFKLYVDWAHEFVDDYETRVTLFGNRRSGQPFSYTYDYSGGSQRSLYGIREGSADDEGELFYVPYGMDDPLFNAAASFGGDADTLAEFFEYLNATGLSDYAGSIAPRNEFESRWYTSFDLRFSQELPGFFPNGAKTAFFLDIENLGNLLSEDWGRLEQVRYEYFQPVANVDIVDGQYVYSGYPERSEKTTYNSASLWQIQLGIKYAF